MSTGWSGGSTRAWRVIRARVLARDRYVCQLKIDGVCIVHAPYAGGPGVAGHVHHTRGKATGDDPRFLVAACPPCNLSVGDPMAQPDPPAVPVTRW